MIKSIILRSHIQAKALACWDHIRLLVQDCLPAAADCSLLLTFPFLVYYISFSFFSCFYVAFGEKLYKILFKIKQNLSLNNNLTAIHDIQSFGGLSNLTSLQVVHSSLAFGEDWGEALNASCIAKVKSRSINLFVEL